MEPSTKRPLAPTPELIAEILGRIAEGQALRRICTEPHAPSIGTFYAWMARDAELAERYVRAREDQAETLADEIAEIADDETLPSDSRRIRIDARKWIAAKLKPKRYGEKIQAEHSGPNGGAIPFETVVRKVVDPKGEK